ncbi:hypothetical protein ABH935_006558 [Catenulispora sp. GAS73]
MTCLSCSDIHAIHPDYVVSAFESAAPARSATRGANTKVRNRIGPVPDHTGAGPGTAHSAMVAS